MSNGETTQQSRSAMEVLANREPARPRRPIQKMGKDSHAKGAQALSERGHTR